MGNTHVFLAYLMVNSYTNKVASFTDQRMKKTAKPTNTKPNGNEQAVFAVAPTAEFDKSSCTTENPTPPTESIDDLMSGPPSADTK